MNIADKSAFRDCTSCSMCAAVCPVDAISIHLDEDGFYRPSISEKCIDCGLCTKVCYKFDEKIRMTDDDGLSRYDLYGASAKDNELLRTTTSGGVADVLAKYLISQGYACIGVIYDAEKNIAKSSVAHEVGETDAFKGSKYIQSYTAEAFKQLVEDFKKNHDTKYAVFGLPCHIYAINRYLTLKGARDRCILIDLFCHGCPSLNVWDKYVKSILNKTDGERVNEAIFRSKIKGWGSGFYVVVVVVVDGVPTPVVGRATNDPFFELFFSNMVLNGSCADCWLRSTLEYTDIRLGDFWGKTYLNNTTGVSAVSIATAKGKEIWDRIKENFQHEQRAFSEFLPYQSWNKTYKVDGDLRRETLDVLNKKDSTIKDAIRVLRSHETSKQRVTRLTKQLLFRFPNVVRFLKRYI